MKFETTSRFVLKQLDYSFSISMRDGWLVVRPHQLSRDRSRAHDLIVYQYKCTNVANAVLLLATLVTV